MDEDLREVLMLAGCGARGEAFHGGRLSESRKVLDCQRLLQRASALGVFHYCVYALQKSALAQKESGSLEAWARETHRLAIAQAVGREKLFGLLKRLHEAGFTYAVMKGCAIAESYGEPFLRVSADTDLFIERSQERRLCRWLAAQGFALERRAPQEYHGTARHREYGLLELHVSFFDARVSEYWKKKAGREVRQGMGCPPVLIEGKQGSFYSLEYTEQMLLMTLHFIRHLFVMEGTLRMLLDNCMYASYYMERIDWMAYWDELEALGYGRLVRTMFHAAECCMGFALEKKGISVWIRGLASGPDLACEEEMEGFLEILCAPEENMRIAERFRDLYKAEEMNLGGHAVWHRWKTFCGVALYTGKYIKKDGFRNVLKRAPDKAMRILTGRDSRAGCGEEEEWMLRCREIYGKLGLMREGKNHDG